MRGGWALVPIIGAGADDDAYRGALAGEAEGDRVEHAALDHGQGVCLTAYDAEPNPRLLSRAILKIADLAELDETVASLPRTRRDRLRGEATNLGADSSGRLRDTIQEIGRRFSPTFDERLHLGQGSAPRPGSFVFDSFTDTAGVGLASHTGETGATWTEHTTFTSGDAVISDADRLRQNNGNAMGYLASGTPASNQYDVAGVLRYLTAVNALGVTGRSSSAANTMYLWQWKASGTVWELYKAVANSYTLLGSYTEALSVGDYGIVLGIRNATKKGYVKGVERVSSTDDTITGVGQVGVRGALGTSASDTTGLHLSLIAATLVDYRDAVFADSPYFYSRLGDANMTQQDEAAGNHDVTLTGATYWATGATVGDANKAVSFDGTNDYGSVALDLSDTAVVTLEFWLWWDAFSNNDDLALEFTANYNSSDGGFIVNPNSSGAPSGSVNVRLRQSGAGGNDYYGWTFARPSAAAWHHYVIVLDRAAATLGEQIKVYLDGVVVGAVQPSPNDSANLTGNFVSSTLYVMSRAGTTLFGAGKLDELAVYKSALSQARVLAHIDAAIAGRLRAPLVSRRAAHAAVR